MIVLALRIGLRWDEILRMPVRSVLALIQAEAEWKAERADDVFDAVGRANLPHVFDRGSLL